MKRNRLLPVNDNAGCGCLIFIIAYGLLCYMYPSILLITIMFLALAYICQ